MKRTRTESFFHGGFINKSTITRNALSSVLAILLVCVAVNAQTKKSRSGKITKPSGGFLDEAVAYAIREARLHRMQGWRYAGETDDYAVSYNVKSAIQPEKSIFRVWTEWEIKYTDDDGRYVLPQRRAKVFGSQAGYEKFKKRLELFEIRCGERQFRILSSVDYDEEGKQLSSNTFGNLSGSGAYSVPGSIGESILEGACRDLRGTRINERIAARPPQPLQLSSSEIARRSFPAVVLLVTEDESGKLVSLGSGLIIQRGFVATSNHVISQASRIFVRGLTQKDLYAVRGIAGVDKERDLAVLRVDSISGSPLPLGNVAEVAVGDPVYAIGNPKGLEGTFSQGVVSGLRGTSYIQITAPISAGSSGGPVLNARGEVIGIATAILDGGQNLNFAIPVSHLSRLMSQLGVSTPGLR